MKGKRAVEIIMEMLNEGDILGDIRLTDERVEALKFAAEALERPQGDCISREALKDEIYTWGCNDYDKHDFIEAIDDAPTAETFTLEDMQNNFDAGVDSIIGKYDKVRGEWIDRMADKGYVECPFCHKQITGGDLNFCVKCGADMRGGAENEETDE
jgi:hypothetical protein